MPPCSLGAILEGVAPQDVGVQTERLRTAVLGRHKHSRVREDAAVDGDDLGDFRVFVHELLFHARGLAPEVAGEEDGIEQDVAADDETCDDEDDTDDDLLHYSLPCCAHE